MSVDVAPAYPLQVFTEDREASSLMQEARDNREQIMESAHQLGALAILKPEVIVNRDDGSTRLRNTGTIELDGYSYAARITEPVNGAADTGAHNWLELDGFTENPRFGTARRRHDATARRFPDSRIASIGTDGVGHDCTPLSWHEGFHKNFDDMAEARLQLVRALVGEQALSVLAVSMGTVITTTMAHRNRLHPTVTLDRLMYVSPAVVQRGWRTFIDMDLRFPLHMGADTVREGMRHPMEELECLGNVTGMHPSNAKAYSGNVKNLLKGTPMQYVHDALAQTAIGVITGSKDPLGQIRMWQRFQNEYGERVGLQVKPGRGHAMSVVAEETALDVAAMWHKLPSGAPTTSQAA